MIAYPKAMTSYIKQLEKDLAYEAGKYIQPERGREFLKKLIGTSGNRSLTYLIQGFEQQKTRQPGSGQPTIPEMYVSQYTFRLEPGRRTAFNDSVRNTGSP